MNLTEKRFAEIQKMDLKELYKLDRKELEAAASMGEARAESVVKELELDDLRKYKQEQEAEKAAAEQAEKIAAEIINKSKEVDSEIEDKINKMVEEKLQGSGVNLANKYTRRLVEQKMHNDAMQKNFMVNSGYGRSALSPEMKQFIQWAKTGQVNKASLRGDIDAQGGYTVPAEFSSEVVRKMKDLVAMRSSGARVITMSSDKMIIPTVTDSEKGGWVTPSGGTTQGQTYTKGEPTFGQIELSPHKYTRLALASYEMLEDSALNVADLLAELFAEDFAVAEDAAFFAGDGVNKPTGLMNAGIAAVTGTNAVSQDNLLKIVYGLARKYRNGAVWYMNDAIIQKVRGLGGSAGPEFWTDGNLTNGEPSRLLGYPVYSSDALYIADLDGAGTGTADGSEIFFGQPKKYYIGDRQGFRLKRSEDAYFETGEIAFRADKRVDGKVALAEAFVKSEGISHV